MLRFFQARFAPALPCADLLIEIDAMSEPSFRTLIEPFRIKSVEPIRMTDRERAGRHLAEARLQPLPPRAERRAHRPAHRLAAPAP